MPVTTVGDRPRDGDPIDASADQIQAAMFLCCAHKRKITVEGPKAGWPNVCCCVCARLRIIRPINLLKKTQHY